MARVSNHSAVLALLAGVLLGLLAAGCREEREGLRLGLSIPTQREERWVRDVEKFRADARARSIDLRLQISDNDAARQLAQCENLLAMGVDVLVVAPHDAASGAVIVDKAHRAGVPVISYDRLILNAAVDLYVSFDNEKVGEIQGAYLTRLVPRGSYVVLAGSPTDNNARMFKAGAMRVIGPLAERGDIRVVMDQWVKDWQPAEAMKLVEDALTATGNRVDAVLAPNDGTAGGAVQALAAQRLAGRVPVTGQDAELSGARRIVQGFQSMTVFKDTRALAAAALAAAADLAAGRAPAANGAVDNGAGKVPSLLLAPVAVDRGNIDAVLIDSGYLRREDVYR